MWRELLLGCVLLSAANLSATVVHGAESPGLARAEEPALASARLQAVAEARNGQVMNGIAKLTQLHAAHPDDPYITADLIVLLRLAGENAQIAELTAHISPPAIPDYALIDWARALRDQKAFARAAAVLGPRRQALGFPGQILFAMATVESGSPKTAIAALPDRHATGLNATDLANMAYVWRRAGNPAQGLALSQQALGIDPLNPQAIREQAFSFSDLTAAQSALTLARRHSALFTPAERNRLRADLTAVRIRDAVQERLRLDDLYRYGERDIPLEQSLAELKANSAAFADDPAQQLRTRYDQIYVLRMLELMPEAIAGYESLPQHPAQADIATLHTIPAYVRRSAADAYLYLHHPHTAAALYEELIAQRPDSDVELFIALYYAYLDGEQYPQAETLLAQIHQVTPVWIGGKIGAENSERLDVDQLWAMDAAFRNHETIGYARMNQLVDRAPRNTGLLNAKATLERWRGWPAQSLQTTELAAAYVPDSKDTRINLAENHRDLEQFALWAREITALHQDFPTDTGIEKSLAQWTDRGNPSISSEYASGRSHGSAVNGNPVTGNRDQELQTRLNSSWTDQGWRAFVDQHYIWSSFAEGPASYNRIGAGAEWRDKRRHLLAMLANDQLTGEHMGVAADWSQWLNDYWQYAISGNTYSLDTPLRAKAAGFSGKSVSTKLNWRQSESLDAYAGLSLLAISDGNERLDFATGLTRRLFANPHHVTSGGIDLFAENNSQPGGAYFNPANSKSASLRLEHQWITWRAYERSFTQYFKASTGYGWQAGFTGNPTIDLLYEHKWQLSRTWDLHYGVGWNSNVYDGGRENRLYGLIGCAGVF